MGRLIDDLNALHDGYAEAVNLAIAADDPARAEQLAAEYDDEAIRLIAVREGKTHLLPLQRPATTDSGLRALLRRLATLRAA
jgi:hypothetical protein